MNGRIILIGNGYVGSAAAAHLRAQGYGVDTVDRAKDTRADSDADCNDLTSFDLGHYDTVIWLAGHSSVAVCRDDPIGAVYNNVAGLADLASRLTTQKLIYASSVSVHARGPSRNVYDATKRAAEELIPVLYPYSWGLRFGTVCGASSRQRWDLMIPAMVRTAVRDGRVVVANPAARRPILGLRDLCRAVEKVVRDKGAEEGGLFDLASFGLEIGEIGARVAKFLSVPVETAASSPTYDIQADTTDFVRRYGFEFSESVESIVARLVREKRDELLAGMRIVGESLTS